jgi:carboxynorspermidine decarboxylase
MVIFNSASQVRALAVDADGARIGVRVNPGVSHSDYDLADPARSNSRLGIADAAELRALVDECPVSGLMFHFNCENEDTASLVASIDALADTFGDVLERMDWTSLGGGIAFTSPAFDLDAFSDALCAFRDRFGVQVYLEPGEAVITGTAELVTTVLDVVHNVTDIAIVDAAVETHLPDHLIYRTSPRLVDAETGSHRVVVAGRTCLAGDEFGTYDLAAPLRVGDRVRFADAAGYTMVKTNWFNGIPMPAIAVRRLDGTVELVREFTYDDFVAHLA